MGWRGIILASKHFGARKHARRALCTFNGEKWVAFIFYHEMHKMPIEVTVIHAEKYIYHRQDGGILQPFLWLSL